MKKLVIGNRTDLLCLGEILRDYPRLLNIVGAKPSAISNIFIKNTFEKIDSILKTVDKVD